MNDRLKDALAHLKTTRDEVRVQIHLGKAELKDDWEELEDKWQHTERKLEKAGDDAKEMAGDAQDKMKVVVDELSAAYARIKERLD